MARKRRSAEDYHWLAKENGMFWVGHAVPEHTLVKTGWECPQGHLWLARWADVWMGRTCPTCKGVDRITRKDYVRMGMRHGIYFVGPVPKGKREKTWWELPGPEKKRVFYSYRVLDERKHPFCPENAEVTRKILEGE